MPFLHETKLATATTDYLLIQLPPNAIITTLTGQASTRSNANCVFLRVPVGWVSGSPLISMRIAHGTQNLTMAIVWDGRQKLEPQHRVAAQFGAIEIGDRLYFDVYYEVPKE